jgi:hypothetical protein
MAVEDDAFEGLSQFLRNLHQMVQKFRGTGVSRLQQRRVLREATRDWLKDNPRADAVRQQINDQTFEQRVAAAVERILADQFAPENAAEQNRDPQQINHPTFEQWLVAEVDRILAERLVPPNAAEQNRDPQQVEVPKAEQGQGAEAPEAAHGEEAVVADEPERRERVVEVLGLRTFLDGDRIRYESASQLLFPDRDRSPAPGAVPGPAEQNRDPRQVEVPEVEAREAEQGEQIEAPEAEVPGVEQQGPVLEQTDQLVSPAVIGEDAPAPVAEQDNNPIFEQLMREQTERQGQKRPEGQQADSSAGDDQAATGDANQQEGQGQPAAAQSPELSAGMQKLRDLQTGGRPSPVGAVERRDGATAVSPRTGATSGANHRTSKDKDGPGGRGDQ